MTDHSWQDDAACAQAIRRGEATLHDWFPPQHSRHNPRPYLICATCPVAAPCLEDATQQATLIPGIWGGTSERTRRRTRRTSRDDD